MKRSQQTSYTFSWGQGYIDIWGISQVSNYYWWTRDKEMLTILYAESITILRHVGYPLYDKYYGYRNIINVLFLPPFLMSFFSVNRSSFIPKSKRANMHKSALDLASFNRPNSWKRKIYTSQVHLTSWVWLGSAKRLIGVWLEPEHVKGFIGGTKKIAQHILFPIDTSPKNTNSSQTTPFPRVQNGLLCVNEEKHERDQNWGRKKPSSPPPP